jgi:sugar lactone lactonase YvrE
MNGGNGASYTRCRWLLEPVGYFKPYPVSECPRKNTHGAKAMAGVTHGSFRSLRCERWCAALLGGLALLLFASSCSGDEPRQQAEQKSERKQPTETGPQAGQGQESGARPRDPQRKLRTLVWVGVEDADQLALVDIARAKVVARHDTPGGPHNVTVAGDGTAAAALYGSDRLALVRRGKAQLVDLGGTPHDVKAAGDLFSVANEAARRLDLVKGGDHATSIDLKAEPHDLAIAPGGGRAWVTLNGTDELAIVDLRARRVERYAPTGKSPHDILFAPDGRLWVTDWDGPVHVFDGRGKLRGKVGLGEESHHLAFTPDGRQAWITDHGANRIFVVDARSLELIDSLRVSGGPHHVAITPDGALAAVADHDKGTVVVYDVKRRTRVRTLHVGSGPHGVWAVPAEKTS